MRTFSIEADAVENREYPSKTYAVQNNRIQGYIDGLEAVKQAINKILNTEMYEYPIYSFDYGQELKKLIGKDRLYIQSELRRIVTEALLMDDRITEVLDFEFDFSEDKCVCTFAVHSNQGVLQKRVEVMV